MTKKCEIESLILSMILELLEDKTKEISVDTALIGDGSVFDSMNIVELCLSLEDVASSKYNFEFDWTSEAAMSRSRSMFRSAGTLANEFYSQMKDS